MYIRHLLHTVLKVSPWGSKRFPALGSRTDLPAMFLFPIPTEPNPRLSVDFHTRWELCAQVLLGGLVVESAQGDHLWSTSERAESLVVCLQHEYDDDEQAERRYHKRRDEHTYQAEGAGRVCHLRWRGWGSYQRQG